MKGTAAITAAFVIIFSASFVGYRELFSSGPEPAGIVKTDDERQAVAKAGMDYLKHLRMDGRLPGVTTNQHGNATISGRLSGLPYSLTMRFNADGTNSTCNYSIVQIEKESPWQLKRAWQTDSNGQIIQEWPVN